MELDSRLKVFVITSQHEGERQQKICHKICAALSDSGFSVRQPAVNWALSQVSASHSLLIDQLALAGANTVVCMLSAETLACEHAQKVLKQAYQYHKRIILVMIGPINLEHLLVELQTRPLINAVPIRPDQHCEQVCDQVMAELNQHLEDNVDYLAQHSQLLVRALRWENSGRDRTLLLRGKDFETAQDWLSAAQQVTKQPSPEKFSQETIDPNAWALTAPTDLHEAYLSASARINQFYDVFISYGRADSKAFATRLYEYLSQKGFQVWFDQQDIPLGVDFQAQISDGLEKSHNFLFIISPHSVNSIYCAKEIEYALQLNKRILPVLQVEEISYETWQSRHPTGTDEQWQSYQADGKHTSFVNMHPAVEKINWVYAREGTDSAEDAFSSIESLIDRCSVYVHQHTELLCKALDWDRQHRQKRYLLTGQARRQAEAWLHQKFEKEQPPCVPTLLHAELITESAQAAAGGMTEVFISYAQVNRAAKDEIYQGLIQAGFTVWTDVVDVQSGEDFDLAIQQGIERADNIVYLISRASMTSRYCQQEIDQALALNKRILPMLVEEVDLDDLTDALRKIQFINLSDNQIELDFAQDLARLLRTLRQDAPYYRQHKRLLVRSLKWERQQKNPSLLLRRQALEQALSWLQIAKDRTSGGVLPLQKAFLAASQHQPPEQTLSVFMSHCAEDIDFSQQLNETLLVHGKSTWFVPEGAEGAADRPDRMYQAIDNAENFLFLLSPGSVRSPACLAQLDYAQSQKKRIVLVIYRDIVQATLPEGLQQLPYHDFRQHEGDFLANFGSLFRALESEPQHVRSHTRLLVKATEWERAHRDDSFLLRGKALSASVKWLAESADKSPAPSELHQAYIEASQALPFKKISTRTVAVATTVVALCISAVRLLGGLQPLEMVAYDQFLRLRPSEAEQDERLLLVTVDSESGEWLREQMIAGNYQPGIGTLPDLALKEAIDLLKDSEARLIGLDFFRDFPADDSLTQTFETTEHLFGICQSASEQVADIGNEGLSASQVGFANLLLDGGKVVRRHYLNQWIDLTDSEEALGCTTPKSFSLQLAKAYLASERVEYTDPFQAAVPVPLAFEGRRDREVAVPRITGDGTAYSGMSAQWGWSSLAGYQTMLNYRTYGGKIEDFAERVSFSALLKGDVSKQSIQDRIVLIGYTDFSDRNSDDFNTPYRDSVPGLYIHAQMTSQLINAVLEERPLIRWWPFHVEAGWILLWSAGGGVIAWRVVKRGSILTANLSALGLLTLSCYGLLLGPVIWVPWVPAALGYGVSGAAVSYLTRRLRQGQ